MLPGEPLAEFTTKTQSKQRSTEVRTGVLEAFAHPGLHCTSIDLFGAFIASQKLQTFEGRIESVASDGPGHLFFIFSKGIDNLDTGEIAEGLVFPALIEKSLLDGVALELPGVRVHPCPDENQRKLTSHDDDDLRVRTQVGAVGYDLVGFRSADILPP